jgi:hypothetical protein
MLGRKDSGEALRRFRDVDRRFLLVMATAVALVVAALAIQRWSNRGAEAQATPSNSPVPQVATPTGPVEARSADGPFTVDMRIESAVYRSGEPIAIRATLTYTGPKARETLAGSGTGLVIYSWEELDGPRHYDANGTDDCHHYSIGRDQGMVMPFAKIFSGESPGVIPDTIPDAAFWRAYFSDPLFRLPAGRYRIHAGSAFWINTCSGREYRMDPSIEIQVLP